MLTGSAYGENVSSSRKTTILPLVVRPTLLIDHVIETGVNHGKDISVGRGLQRVTDVPSPRAPVLDISIRVAVGPYVTPRIQIGDFGTIVPGWGRSFPAAEIMDTSREIIRRSCVRTVNPIKERSLRRVKRRSGSL